MVYGISSFLIADSNAASDLSHTSSKPTLISGLVDNLISKDSKPSSV